MNKVFLFFGLLLCNNINASLTSEWKYSKASNELEKGNYAHAQNLMQSILVEEPSRPDLLYDLGVASFKNKEYSQAAAYFASAAKADACPAQLQEQSYFNLGNTSVGLNQLNDAIVHYEKVLELNEQNEMARHNLEVVKKMLEDQKQQEQQNNDDQQDKDQQDDQNKDDQDKQDKQDKSSNDGQNGDNGNDDKDGDQNESKNDSSDKKDEKQNQQSKEKNKDNKENNSDQKKDNKKDASQGDQKDQQSGGKDKKENPADQKDKSDNANKQEPKPDDSSCARRASSRRSEAMADRSEDRHNKQIDAGGQKEGKEKKANASAPEQAGIPREPDLAPEDQWILQVLNQREKDEKKTSKQLIRASIDKKLGGQHGQNCW